ncbi:MAG: CHAD domain-containing protein [Xanthobacteraceae bacterium]
MNNKPALRPQGAVGDGLRAAARDILFTARNTIIGPEESEASAVHDFRKAIKQWRALLRLLEPLLGPDARKLRLAARELAHRLALARDGQAALDALADLGEAHDTLPKRSMASLARRLEALKASAQTTESLGELRPRLLDYLQSATKAVEHWELEPYDFSDIADCLAKTYRRARAAVPDDWWRARPEDLHALRRRIIEHRYQLELIEPLWPRMNRLWVDEAQRLRNRLGAHHDLVVLAGLTARDQPLAPWRARLAPLITSRQADHIRAAARLTNRLLAEKPKALRRRLEALWASNALAP